MRWIGRWLKRLGVVLIACVCATWVSLAPGDPELYPGDDAGIRIHVVDHGHHTGLIIEASDLRRAAVAVQREDVAAAMRLRWLASRFPDAEWLEIGWGDSAFYQTTPSVSDIRLGLGLKALFVPTPAVLQAVPGLGPAATAFPASDKVLLVLSPEGLTRLAMALAQTIPEPVPGAALGPSLYGGGAFFAAELDYHLFRTCNHWVSWLLREAGVPSSAVPGTLSATLMAELRWRAL